jgi:hypothetical protein
MTDIQDTQGAEAPEQDSEFSTAFAEAAAAREAEQARLSEPDDDDAVGEPAPDRGDGDGGGDEPPDIWARAPEAARSAYQQALAEQERLRHSVHSNAGRVSALQRKINELESHLGRQVSAAAAPPGTPSAQEINDAMQTPESWASFTEEYPEVARAVDSRIGREIARLEQTLSPLREQIVKQQQAEAQQFQHSQEGELSKAYPNWKQTINTPEFHEWFQSQPTSIQTLVESDYADDAIALLNYYSGSMRERGAPNTGRVSEIQAARQRRLEQSVETPSRRGAQRPLDEDDFSSAFKAAAAKKMRGNF